MSVRAQARRVARRSKHPEGAAEKERKRPSDRGRVVNGRCLHCDPPLPALSIHCSGAWVNLGVKSMEEFDGLPLAQLW